ncbi:MAG: DUF177 domain-containing protein [Bacteroidales bacterium]|nr:DUF177 domain-containing protein [Bacteroidales bacterium]
MLNVEITAKIIFTKRAQVHTLELNMNGKVEVPCDRCLEPVSIAIKNSQECIVKIASENDEFTDTENVILIESHEKEIDITHLLYENILLALPLKKVHAQGKCNTAMTAYIGEAHKIKQETIDPRWDLLRNINSN